MKSAQAAGLEPRFHSPCFLHSHKWRIDFIPPLRFQEIVIASGTIAAVVRCAQGANAKGNAMKTVIGTSALVAAVMFAAIPGASAQGNSAFCLKKGSGQVECTYQTMAQCEQSRKGASTEGSCVANPQTTGSGAGSQPPMQRPAAPQR